MKLCLTVSDSMQKYTEIKKPPINQLTHAITR